MSRKKGGQSVKAGKYWAEISQEELIRLLKKGITVDPNPQSDEWTRPTYVVFKQRVDELNLGEPLPAVDEFKKVDPRIQMTLPMRIEIIDYQLQYWTLRVTAINVAPQDRSR